jgi:crossover junction endodeoxyribonuclease RuvC
MLIVGIDPGLSGAIAFVNDGELLSVADLPLVEVQHGKGSRKELSPALLHDMLIHTDFRIGKAIVEHVGASPQMGSVSAFRFGENFGAILAVLACCGIRTELVRPAAWKKAMALGPDKALSRAMAIKLWPMQSEYFARVKDDGRAEAALLAEFGRRWTENYP